ncbi:DUF3093 domain-containing protein [Nocardioides gilvus]|uniref:DUF3093 domain-containing protein n=1 Tax=Nocardioides gilvus TaxID=1735589 RepID=UPI000D74DD95|nr:DUF3093 domain-containing protein [Nocardioides gilvus]
MEYSERLHVPLRWWVQGTMLVATFWLTLLVALPEPLAWALTAVALVAMAAAFLAYGARVSVDGSRLRAGKAHIGIEHLGAAEALDKDETRRVAGVEADARAHLVLRPYLKRSVRVVITDPDDSTPYWLISTRHPDALVSALDAAGRATNSSVR